MVGIILTLVAVLLVICFAFCFADPSLRRDAKAEMFFYSRPKGGRKEPDAADK